MSNVCEAIMKAKWKFNVKSGEKNEVKQKRKITKHAKYLCPLAFHMLDGNLY